MGGNKISLKFKLIIVGLLLIFFIICIVYYFNTKQEKSIKYTDKSSTNLYTDPGTGETVNSPPGKSKEKTDPTNTITFLGFTSFLDHGLSYNQLNKLKSHFNQYSLSQKKPIYEVSITLSSFKTEKKDGKLLITSEITVDRKNKYNISIDRSKIDNVELFIYNQSTNAQIYKSYNGGGTVK